ncbi:CPBP family intramembrane metalloprotease [Sphingomonas lacunae]|uniref:CPBP family intramembrane metalloprotease n=1 Tax=Sphingomonas lacunae TaxID=2698828 RepID=A0A6M4AVS9_9SPHN|nr:CPBP family intramembrane glutamic endopeptidase [Sphingomonas lacunae]QJQ33248.1 CPBP family intramembrane metalloprotease [Sphingomonas lacunae]
MGSIDTESLGRRIIAHPFVLMIISAVMVIGSVIGIGIIGNQIHRQVGGNMWLSLGLSCAVAVVATGVYWLFVRYVERKPVTDLATGGALREWGTGVVLGFAAMALSIGVIAVLGGYVITGTNPVSVLVPVLGMAIMAGVWEEILFRGILFRFTEQWLGSWFALVFTSALFGLAHIANPAATWLSSAAIALEAGILLGALYMLTRRLWAVIGLHMAWNFTQGGIFGVAVSGGETRGLIASQMQGHPLLTGGDFGAEASLPAMVVCTAMGLAALFLAWQRGHFVSASWQRFKSGRGARD